MKIIVWVIPILLIVIMVAVFAVSAKLEHMPPEPFNTGDVVHHKLTGEPAFVIRCLPTDLSTGSCLVSTGKTDPIKWKLFEIKEYEGTIQLKHGVSRGNTVGNDRQT